MVRAIDKKKLKKAYPLVKLLAKLCADDRKVVVEYLNDEAHEVLCECVHNGLNNRGIVGDRKKLCQGTIKCKEDLRYISSEKRPLKQRRKKLIQHGGSVIGLILSAVLPLLASAIIPKLK
jgi:hypothetical protein